MKYLLVAVLFAVCVAAFDRAELDEQWKLFKQTHNKIYSEGEEARRQVVFAQSLRRIEERNAGLESPVFGVTKFSDLTPEEFKSRMLGFKRVTRPEDLSTEIYESAASSIGSIDWRTKGMVTPVKDQGQCGSCWAFSAVEETESMWLMAGKGQLILSEQQVVSCDKQDGGCNGGDTPTAYAYIKQAGGLESESSYPYTSGNTGNTGSCKFDASKIAGGDNKGYTWAVPECESRKCDSQNETQLLLALQTAPISICVNAEPWQDYRQGVMTASSCGGKYNELDHCVQLVGYSTQSGSYYIVRNSWAADWGIDGYIHLSVGENTCGVADEATIVKIA